MRRFLVNMQFKPVNPFPGDPTISRVQVIAPSEKKAHDIAMERVQRTLSIRGVKDVLFKGDKPIPVGGEF